MPESTRRKHGVEYKFTLPELAKLSEALVDLDWRLLHWLLLYPLQRSDDLVVGVARWASRATVYRHIQALEARGLLESVLPKMPGEGKRLYHLSNAGLHLVALYRQKPAHELARLWHADEAGLLRLLPRLPTLLVLQNVVNGLVDHAAEAITTRGRRPRLVRWNWQRNVVHRFLYREQKMHLFADGAVALCVRSQQSDGSTLDEWYGLFLLFTELGDERLMRLRLDRLLCWRESPERWPYYTHMLPVLILAGTPRQREHWQRAVEATTLKLRLDAPVGAVASLPPPESGRVNPWLLNWHTLSTRMPCHLQDLLKPLPKETLPQSLGEAEGENDERDAGPRSIPVGLLACSGTSIHLRQLMVGGLTKRTACIVQDEPGEQEVVALLGLRLTANHWRILYLLLAHPWLSEEELAAFLNLQRKSVRCALYELHRLGCLEPIVTSVGKRWHCCGRGLRLIAAANHLHIGSLAERSDGAASQETSTIAQRGEAWLLRCIEHTAGLYGFFARLAQAARMEGEQALCWWETGAACERRYRMGEQWYNLRPDALAAYRTGSQQFHFWLEWDRGTMNVRDLVVKFSSYAHFVASREWAREFSRLPRLLCIAPELAQERRIQRVAQARLEHVGIQVLRTTTAVLLQEHGPLAPIWWPGLLEHTQASQQIESHRQCLFAASQPEQER